VYDWKWSDAEKKLSRAVVEEARLTELAETLADFKARAAALTSIGDMWPLEDYLRSRRRELDEKYEYRYSHLPWLFARLLREGRIKPEQLSKLSEEKLNEIRRMATR
jgi:hypothetical protein